MNFEIKISYELVFHKKIEQCYHTFEQNILYHKIEMRIQNLLS